MAHNWNSTRLTSVKETLDLLNGFQKDWLFRGQSGSYNSLIPSIDRGEKLRNLNRSQKLVLERKSIDLFRTNVTAFVDRGEEPSIESDMIALMVLRHYGVPTRLIDWSSSPFTALFFAVSNNLSEDGELWAFNRKLYEEEGAKQWKLYPQTTTDGSGDRYKFDPEMPTAFETEEQPDWFVCLFYTGFPRQIAQNGAYSFTSQFNKDHTESIHNLLKDPNQHHLYIIPAKLKKELQVILRMDYNKWRGPLFPDSAGAAETAKIEFNEFL